MTNIFQLEFRVSKLTRENGELKAEIEARKAEVN